MPLPRRKIEEIVALHSLEPRLVDFFVEGSTEAHLLEWLLHSYASDHVQIYPIENIEIENELPSGNRGRLLTLAKALASSVDNRKVACICDRDFERWIPSVPSGTEPIVFLTDFANTEGYLFTTDVLRKLLLVAMGAKVQADTIVNVLTAPLQEAFLIRLAHARLEWPLHWIDMTRSCSLQNSDTIEFKQSKFIIKLLQKNHHSRDQKRLEKEIAYLRPQLHEDPRLSIHGHDFTGLLCWYLKKRGYRRYSTAEQIFHTMLSCVDRTVLSSYPMLKDVVERAQHRPAPLSGQAEHA